MLPKCVLRVPTRKNETKRSETKRNKTKRNVGELATMIASVAVRICNVVSLLLVGFKRSRVQSVQKRWGGKLLRVQVFGHVVT